MMPVLNPAGVQEFLDFGLHGWAMSRFSGCWVGMRAIADTVETSAGVVVDPRRVETRLPADFAMPPGGLSIRWPDPPLDQEWRLAALQGLRRHGLCAGQRAEPGGDRQPPRAARHRHHRQVLPRRAPGARRARHRRGARRRDRAARLQDRHDLAAGRRGRAALRRGPGGDPGRRGEAAGHRVPAQGAALQLARGRAPARHRQVRRDGRVGAARRRLAAPGRRRADAGARSRASSPGAWSASTPATGSRSGSTSSPPRRRRWRGPAPAASRSQRVPHYCSGCPHNTSTQGAGRQPRARRDRLPLHGAVALPGPDADLQPDGRRGRALGRPGALHRDEARLRQPRRRHLLALGAAGHPPGGRGEGADHLQDPVQRRGRHDRRPAGRGHADRAADRPPGRPRRASSASSSSPTTPRATRPAPCRPGCRSATAGSSTPCSASCASTPACLCWSTTRPAPRRSAAGASAA